MGCEWGLRKIPWCTCNAQHTTAALIITTGSFFRRENRLGEYMWPAQVLGFPNSKFRFTAPFCLTVKVRPLKNIVRTGSWREREVVWACSKLKALCQEVWGWPVLKWSERSDCKNILNSHFSKYLLLKQDNAGESIIMSSLSSEHVPEVNKRTRKKDFISDVTTLGEIDQWASCTNFDGQKGWAERQSKTLLPKFWSSDQQCGHHQGVC